MQGNDEDDKVFGNARDNVSQWNVGDDNIDGGDRNDFLRGGECDDIFPGDGDEKLYVIISDEYNEGLRGQRVYMERWR